MPEPESTILIVEDDPRGRELLALQLRPLGYRLEFAGDGREGVEKAREFDPDLVISDVMMPEMTGFDLCRELRADERLKEVPILLITALDDRDSRLEGIEAGADEFISKPFDGHELRARIRLIGKLNRDLRPERPLGNRVCEPGGRGNDRRRHQAAVGRHAVSLSHR